MPKPEGAKCTRAEINKCHASQARKYPMGTATMDTFRGQKNQTRDELCLIQNGSKKSLSESALERRLNLGSTHD